MGVVQPIYNTLGFPIFIRGLDYIIATILG
nr:hypothetical protein CoNPh38_CDS0209 [Staphylococcus phage S-CoN_Ph38]